MSKVDSILNQVVYSLYLLSILLYLSNDYCYGFHNDDDFGCVIKVRGLPWTTTVEEIMDFFRECRIKNEGVHIALNKEGRPSGVAYVEMQSKYDVDLACSKHKQFMSHRYIEVYFSSKQEMERAITLSKMSIERVLNDGCVRLRGLPFKCAEQDIIHFFRGLALGPNGITIITDYNGKTTGEAYVQFKNREIADRALEKHGENLQHRYIEVFRSSLGEIRMAKLNRRSAVNNYNEGGQFSRQNSPDFNAEGDNDYEGDNYNEMHSNKGKDQWVDYYSFNQTQHEEIKINNVYKHDVNSVGVEHQVLMRGLPYGATLTDISLFFKPINTVDIQIIYDKGGRPTGRARVTFATHQDALKAMAKENNYIYNRYIELLLKSTE